jgi:hypothetical protein
LKEPEKRSIVRANIDHQISAFDVEALHDVGCVSPEVVDEHRRGPRNVDVFLEKKARIHDIHQLNMAAVTTHGDV